MNISIRQIKAFLALVEDDNFTRAAKKVHLSQPAFSALISSLEKEIGYRLFNRDTRKVELTQDGMHFIKLAQAFISAYEETIEKIKDRAGNYQSKMVLAVMPSILVRWISLLLSEFHHNYPKIKVELMDLQWDQCLQALLKGRAELALTATSPSVEEITSELLFKDQFYLVCHKDHPFADKQTIKLADLSGQDIIGFTRGTSIRLYTDQLMDTIGAKYVLEVSQLTSMMGLVSANYGVGLVPELTLFQFQHSDIRVKEIVDMNLQRSIYLIKHKTRKLSPQASIFYKHIKNNIFEC